jgi:hypothetical protein
MVAVDHLRRVPVKIKTVLPLDSAVPNISIGPWREPGTCPPNAHSITPPSGRPATVTCDCGLVTVDVYEDETGHTVLEWDDFAGGCQ